MHQKHRLGTSVKLHQLKAVRLNSKAINEIINKQFQNNFQNTLSISREVFIALDVTIIIGVLIQINGF